MYIKIEGYIDGQVLLSLNTAVRTRDDSVCLHVLASLEIGSSRQKMDIWKRIADV
mgnify:CR=1 FL=1